MTEHDFLELELAIARLMVFEHNYTADGGMTLDQLRSLLREERSK